MTARLVRFVLYFVLALGWRYLYVAYPRLNSNTPFVYQEF